MNGDERAQRRDLVTEDEHMKYRNGAMLTTVMQ